MSCLVEKYCLGENVDKAKEICVLLSEVLVSGLCKKRGAMEAFKVLKTLVSEKAVVPVNYLQAFGAAGEGRHVRADGDLDIYRRI
jgi:hypothetical protein